MSEIIPARSNGKGWAITSDGRKWILRHDGMATEYVPSGERGFVRGDQIELRDRHDNVKLLQIVERGGGRPEWCPQ
jgi:hypothetical protein